MTAMRLFVKTVVLCGLLIFICPLPASAQDEPDWAAGTKKEDSLYKYYVGRAEVGKSERDAFNQGYEDARDQAIRENFGVKTVGTHQSYEDQQGVRYTSRVNDVYPGDILVKDFEMIDSFIKRNTLYCLYRYKKEAISQEKQRLEKSTPSETTPAYTSSKGSGIRKGGLDIQTTPEEDVQVIIDNEPYGKTPVHLEHKLDPGQHTLRLEHPFYYTITEQLIIPENEVVVIHKTMNRATGTLKINTRPVADAKIFIDGNLIGNSPLEYNVYVGISSRIVAEHPETESMTTQVELTKNEYKVLTLDLVLKPSTLSIYTNPPGSAVYIDNEKVGDSPVIKRNVPAHRALSVRIKKEGYVDIHIKGSVSQTQEPLTDIKRRHFMGDLYVGLDLHSGNTYMGIMEGGSKKRVYQKRHKNNLEEILQALEPFRDEVKGIVVESTYNWFWLVDGLMAAEYKVHLANPSAMNQYEGIKYVDDRHDAFWLAHLLMLGILPEGYIYPKEDRPVRDLLRKRSFLIRHRTANILSCQSMIERNTGKRIDGAGIKKLNTEDLGKILTDEYLVFSGKTSTNIIAVLTHHITSIEKKVRKVLKIRPGLSNCLQ